MNTNDILEKNYGLRSVAGVNTATGRSNLADVREINNITTKQLAEQLKTTKDVILKNARMVLPNKKIELGKPTFWNEREITMIIGHMKTHQSNSASVELKSTVNNTMTTLTPVLKIKNIVDNINTEEEENLLIQASMQLLSKRLNKIQDENYNLREQNQELRNDKDFLQQQSRVQNELLDIFREKLDPRTEKQKQKAKYVYMQD
jgi:hypothetical protein